MDIESRDMWVEYSKDEVFLYTNIPAVPRYTVEADDKRRVRLNRICYVLDQIPYKHVIPGKIKRPKRKEQGEYQRPPQSNLTAAPKNIEVFLHRPVCKTHPYL